MIKVQVALGYLMVRFWLKQLLVLSLGACAFAQNPATTVNVDVHAGRHDISPLIYGVNLFESANTAAILEDLNAPINRYGGNRASTYNWQLNSDNRGNDFFFESITDDAGTIPARRTDDFITSTKAASSEPMVTIPMLSWIAKSGIQQPLPCSYPRSSFPDQFQFGDDSDPDCGDGLAPDRTPINGADPNIAFVPNSLANQQDWVTHTLNVFHSAATGGLKYYILDNEHDLWPETHHDAVATAPHHDEDTSAMLDYAAMIKAQDSGAFVAGPEASGWLGYIYSPFDNQDGRLHNFANDHVDHDAVGDYLPWFLSQFKAYADTHNGQRLLDYFTVHYYPQGNDPINVNTRSLWDPGYVDNSFIATNIMLIPRMKQWVADNYPGTKIGITEYNWGDINDEVDNDTIAFAVAEADVLGIFGREGLDLATRFNAPVQGKPTYNAMKMYRNYDGQRSTFGDVSVSAAVENPDNVAAFAAQRTADNKVTIVLLNKYSAGDTPVTLNVANFPAAATAQRWQLSGLGASIESLADVNVQNGVVQLSVPPQSVTLLVLSQQESGAPAPIATFSRASINFGSQLLNTFSLNSTVTLTNTGNAPLNISGLSLSGEGLFQVTNCPMVLPAAMSCMISLKPTHLGALNGLITVTDDAFNSPQMVSVAGSGLDIFLNTPRPTRSRRLTAQGSIKKRRVP